MRRWLAALLFAISPLAVQAQQINVRSGDHEEFTRLVFNLPSRIEWSIENTGNEAVLRFGRQGLSFDTSTVFDRIRRDRLAALDVDGDRQTVTLRFACKCEATGFWFRQSMLVIDVAARTTDVPGLQNRTTGEDGTPALQLPMRGRSPATAMVDEAIGFGAPGGYLEPEMTGPLLYHTSLEQSRDRLLREFSRATSQGLLAPKETLPKPVGSRGERPRPEPPKMAAEASEPVTPTPSPRQNINVQTGVDRDFLSALEAGDETGFSSRCLDARLSDVAGWGSDEPFWEQVGPLRGQMTSELDRIQEGTVQKLAEVYLYFGFGVEARNIVSLLPDGSDRKRVYEALAQIMEQGSAEGSILADQLDCDAPGAMWAALSHNELPTAARLDKNAILRTFSALPPHLRKHLGPILSARLLSAGHMRESAAIVRILDRAEETMTPAADMVAADLQLESGEAEAAEENLETVVEANREISPEALSRQIDSRIERGALVPVELAQLASAYAYEHAGTPLGRNLTRSHVLALGASGAFDDAFSELDRLAQDEGLPVDDIRADLTDRLATHGAPFDILRHFLSGSTARPDQLSQESALALAEHLLEAGFHQQSQDLLAQVFHGRNKRKARLIRARTALELGQPRRAEVELLGLEGKEVNILRAQARSMVGEHRQAYELFKSAGMEEEAAREAWLAGSGASDDTGQPELEDATGPDGGAPQNGVLAQNKRLLEDAVVTRDSLRALLAEAPGPGPES